MVLEGFRVFHLAGPGADVRVLLQSGFAYIGRPFLWMEIQGRGNPGERSFQYLAIRLAVTNTSVRRRRRPRMTDVKIKVKAPIVIVSGKANVKVSPPFVVKQKG